MCFFYSLPKQAKQVAKRYNKQLTLFDSTKFDKKVLIAGYNHTDSNLIITDEHDVQFAKWGLIPFWSKEEHAERIIKSNQNVNAREETVYTKPSFREPIENKRCLIPASGWFEYHYEGSHPKEVYYMSVIGEEIFSFTGIYDYWTDKKTGERRMTYAILTCMANEKMYSIHNGGANPHRMPVILHRKDEKKWLDPNTAEDELKALMQPFPDELMDAYVISRTPAEFRKSSPFDYDLTDKL